ncbi:MAG: hypothetical protein LBS33_05720 [Streptococcaceae bacterium]|jgi:hypothetical protein|nr:hypothetical protein [Streptococcaceae bacterium]
MIDQVFKKTGINELLENTIPNCGETLNSLVTYRILNKNEHFDLANEWYRKSFAQVLYPQANLDFPDITEILRILGLEGISRKLFF